MTARATKTSIKKWIRAASNFIALNPFRLICQMLQNFLELNSNLGLYQSSGKGKESCCLLFPSSTKREIRHFHFVVVQRRLRNVQKSVMHVQSCCFANLNFFAVLVAVARWSNVVDEIIKQYFLSFQSPPSSSVFLWRKWPVWSSG